MNQEYIPSDSAAMSPCVKNIMAGKIAATKEYECTGLSAVNAHQKYKYAKLNDIYYAVKGALGNHHIDISHFRLWIFDRLFLVTRLTHSQSGEWIQDMTPVENEKPGHQGHGAALTYMKKYAVLNLCAIATEEDDDGHEEQRYIEAPRITGTQQEELTKLIKEHSDSLDIWKSIAGRNRISNLNELKASEYNGVKYFIVNYKKPVQK